MRDEHFGRGNFKLGPIETEDPLGQAVGTHRRHNVVVKSVPDSRRKQRRTAASGQDVANPMKILDSETMDMPQIDSIDFFARKKRGKFLRAVTKPSDAARAGKIGPHSQDGGRNMGKNNLSLIGLQYFTQPSELTLVQSARAGIDDDKSRLSMVKPIVRTAETGPVKIRVGTRVRIQAVVISDDGQIGPIHPGGRELLKKL